MLHAFHTDHAFREDVERTKKLLEDVAAVPVYGYRAASFSIGKQTPWAYDVLAEAGPGSVITSTLRVPRES